MRNDLVKLATAIGVIESKQRCFRSKSDSERTVRTGWDDIDRALHRGLLRGVIHEWFGPHEPTITPLPLTILIHLAWRALDSTDRSLGQRIIWIGRSCWPFPPMLIRHDDDWLLRQSLFIDPPDDASRLWAIDQTLRSPAALAVIADGRGIDMVHSRRLQLAAESGGALALLGRPCGDLDQLSAATTRWLVQPLPSLQASSISTFPNPRWTVELLRCKGVRPSLSAQRRWALERDHAQGVVCSSPVLADRPVEATHATPRLARRSA